MEPIPGTKIKRPGRPRNGYGQRRRAADALFRKVGLDPLEQLLRIAASPTTEEGTRIDILKELLPYAYPKLRAVEISEDPEAPVGTGMVDAFRRAVEDARAAVAVTVAPVAAEMPPDPPPAAKPSLTYHPPERRTEPSRAKISY